MYLGFGLEGVIVGASTRSILEIAHDAECAYVPACTCIRECIYMKQRVRQNNPTYITLVYIITIQ